MSYNNNWAKKLKEAYLEEKKARQVVNEQVEGSRGPRPMVPVKKVKPATGNVRRMADKIAASGKAVLSGMGKDAQHLAGIPAAAGSALVKALGRRGGPDAAMHLGKGGMHDHVEHEGNSLQEEVALNEHLLMLIDILCEELGIDVEDLLSEDFTTAAREDELTQGVLSAVSQGDHSRAAALVKRLDNESADNRNVYGKGGKKLKKAAGFRRVPGARKSSSSKKSK
jgi:hypothetical protein